MPDAIVLDEMPYIAAPTSPVSETADTLKGVRQFADDRQLVGSRHHWLSQSTTRIFRLIHQRKGFALRPSCHGDQGE
jgi:hypothetical protein